MKQSPKTIPYQTEAVEKCVAELKKSGLAQCHMAPGSGKTVVSLLIKEELKPKTTIFFVPTIQLIYQQYLSWAKFNSKPFDALVVTSGRITAEDRARLHTLEQSHIGATTNDWEINQFLQGHNNQVIFSTYRSAPAVISACVDQSIDLAVFDEAHHVAGGFDKRATRLLSDANIDIKKRLFMTATPRMNRDEELSLIYAGMNDEELFGKVAYHLSVRAAIHKTILCDYELVAAAVTPDDIAAVDVKGTKEEKTALAAIRKMMKSHDLRYGLTFHSKIKNAAKFSKDLISVLDDDVYVSTLNSTHKPERRASVINNLMTSEKGILTNVRVLGEGFDFKALDFIVFVDPKRSHVDLVQNVGRVMRKCRGKEIGTIIVPVLVDDAEDSIQAEAAASSGQFMPVYHIATALGILDNMLGAEIAQRRATGVQGGDLAVFFQRRFKIAGVEEMTKAVIDELSKKVQMHALYGTRAAQTDSSIQRVQELFAFCEKHDRLPSYQCEEEKSLFNIYMRLTNRDTSPLIKSMLEPIRRRWGRQSKILAHWEKRLNEVLVFCEKHGHQPAVTRSIADRTTLHRIGTNDLPEGVEEAFGELIEQVKAYPNAMSVRSAKAAGHVEGIEKWAHENKRLPSIDDVRKNKISETLYEVFGRRNQMNNPDHVERLRVLVMLYGGVGGINHKAGNKQDRPHEEARQIFLNRDRQKLDELTKWIRKHGSLPTPKTNKTLYNFATYRQRKTVNPIKREIINEVIEQNKKYITQKRKTA